VIALAWLALAMQANPPQAIAAVDRDSLSVGEELTLTIRVTSTSAEPVQVLLPQLTGLEVVARTERTEVTYNGGSGRITTVELRLRGTKAGTWRAGPFEVRQGPHVVQVDAVRLVVAPGSATGAVATTLNARVQRILERAPSPPAAGRVALTLILSSDTVLLGEQVDVLTAAWFPRDLRLQLRRPPTLEAPQIDGVWNYPQPTPSGIAASRNIGGVWYDVFVVHQVIFPLAPGGVQINPATLRYSVPLAIQFFSQEERYTLSSTNAVVTVLPLPDENRSAWFSGAIGHQITLRRTVSPGSGRVGEPLNVELTVSGEGNVALWPAPAFSWPPEVRAYSDRVDEKSSLVQGRLAGTKTFHYLVVPDSAGTLLLPSIRYAYFDPSTRSYPLTELEATPVGIARGAVAGAPKALPPGLLYQQSPALAWRLMHAVPEIALILFALLFPVAWLVVPLVRRLRHRAPPPPPRDELAFVHRELGQALERLGLSPGTGGTALRHALQQAGVPAALVRETVEWQDRLQAARFAAGEGSNRTTLIKGARALLAKLGEWCDAVRGPAGRAAAIVAVLLIASPLRGQAPPPEQLYEAGAVAEAATGFAKRAEADPWVAAHWYNLGAARFRQGEEGKALAAWTTALRLTPRDRHVRQALRLVPPADAESAARLWTAPVTPEELGLIALVAWTVGWVGLIVRRRPRGRWFVVLGAAIFFAASAGSLVVWYDRPIAVVTGPTRLLGGPYGRAPSVAAVEQGSVLLLERREGPWWLARDGQGRSGWIPDNGLARVKASSGSGD